MSREIANAGFNLTNNGIVDADSGLNEIRVRSNLSKFDYDASVSDASRNNVQDSGEDITYFINEADNTKYLAEHDQFGSGSTVLANRIDSMNIHYFDQKVTYTAPPGGTDITDMSAAQVSKANAKYIVIAVSVTRRSWQSQHGRLSTALLSFALFRCHSAQYRPMALLGYYRQKKEDQRSMRSQKPTLFFDSRAGERGAALITAVLLSMLLLAAGGTLILTATMTGITARDSTAEMQAYYAAEAGVARSLEVLRGNVVSNPAGTLLPSTMSCAHLLYGLPRRAASLMSLPMARRDFKSYRFSILITRTA